MSPLSDGSSDDRRLCDEALAGKAGALRELIALLTPVVQVRVASVVMRTAGGSDPRQEVKDLTQEVFLRLFAESGRLLRAWDPARGASLKGYVGLIAQRQAISARRGGALPILSDDLAEFGSALSCTVALPEQRVAMREELELVLERLQARLSPLGLDLFYRLLIHDEAIADVVSASGLTANAIYIWRNRLLALTMKIQSDLRSERGSGPMLLPTEDGQSDKAVGE